ncbi:hypothetical protein BHE74_00040143 [Ensete ventricosum]|nr:hypothetical protein GW17_00032872 [Ensete ventricosum]RWW53377.1 hypothetical protein BHE74_00040143 [Ensete ventricosum]RZS17879.1 hypothetical protein BHM03_00050083 [Ensete ventricosum]
MDELDAWAGSSEAYPDAAAAASGWSPAGSAEGEAPAIESAAAEERHPMLALFFIAPTPSVRRTPKSRTPPPRAGHVRELCPLLLQCEHLLVISAHLPNRSPAGARRDRVSTTRSSRAHRGREDKQARTPRVRCVSVNAILDDKSNTPRISKIRVRCRSNSYVVVCTITLRRGSSLSAIVEAEEQDYFPAKGVVGCFNLGLQQTKALDSICFMSLKSFNATDRRTYFAVKWLLPEQGDPHPLSQWSSSPTTLPALAVTGDRTDRGSHHYGRHAPETNTLAQRKLKDKRKKKDRASERASER